MQEQKQKSEPQIIRLVRTQEDLKSVKFEDYERIVVAIKNQEKDGNAVARMLFQQDIRGYQIQCRKTNGIKELGFASKPYVEYRKMSDYQQLPAISQTTIQRKPSCEMPRPVRPMSVEEIAEFCAAMPPGIGEEEYCARVIDYLEDGGDDSGAIFLFSNSR